MKILAENRKAKFDYEIKENFTAGMVLTGPEVKSVKQGNVSLAGSYVSINAGQAFLINCHIGPYKYASQSGYTPTQTRKLLLKKSELLSLLGKEKGLVVIPLDIFLGNRGLIKIRIALGKPRKKTDKREYIKTREAKKEIRQLT